MVTRIMIELIRDASRISFRCAIQSSDFMVAFPVEVIFKSDWDHASIESTYKRD